MRGGGFCRRGLSFREAAAASSRSAPPALPFFLSRFLFTEHGFCSARRERTHGRIQCTGLRYRRARSESFLGECGELDDVSRVRLVMPLLGWDRLHESLCVCGRRPYGRCQRRFLLWQTDTHVGLKVHARASDAAGTSRVTRIVQGQGSSLTDNDVTEDPKMPSFHFSPIVRSLQITMLLPPYSSFTGVLIFIRRRNVS